MTYAGLLILTSGFLLITLAIIPEVDRRIRGGVLQTVKQGPNYKYWGFGAIAIGFFASVVDHGSVNIALPTIASHFGTDLPTVQWVVIAFALTVSAFILPMGRLSDLLGHKEVYVAGSLVTIGGAALAGFATHLPMLILARIVMGLGAAMSQGTGMAIVTAIFPANQRGKAIGLVMTIVGTGAVAGPAVGGLLVGALGWRSVFFFNVPLGIAGVLATMVILEGRRSQGQRQSGPQGSFDWLGAILSTGALVTFLLTIVYVRQTGWTSPAIMAAALGFATMLGGFIWWELRCSAPMLDLRLFREKTFSFGVSAAFLTFLGSSAVLFITPFYLQQVLGKSPVEAGLFVVPGALFMAVLGPMSGQLSDRYGWRTFTVGGLVFSVSGLLILSQLTIDSSSSMILLALILQSCGMGTFYSPNTSSMLTTVSRERYGVVVSFLNLVRNAANVSSVVLATTIITATMASQGYEPSLAAVSCGANPGTCLAFIAGMRNAYVTMMCLLLTAMAVSAFKFRQLRDTPPVPST